MATSLLSEGGEQGARVIGATAVNVRTGEFYVFRAKATVLATAQPLRMWVFSTELQGFAAHPRRPQLRGRRLRHGLGRGRGADAHGEERSALRRSSAMWPYGIGQRPQHLVRVQHRGCERQGSALGGPGWASCSRPRPSATGRRPGQEYFLYGGRVCAPSTGRPSSSPTFPSGSPAGEFTLPLYADLPSMPEDERRAIFGLMLSQEGKCRIPVYDVYTQAGFDPDKDLLQAPVMPPDGYVPKPWWSGQPVRQWRESGFLVDGGGVVFDWDLRTTLEGLYAAGVQFAAGADHAASACTGRYAGRKAAEYARSARAPSAARAQIDKEKSRVYAPVNRTEGVGWKELQAGLCRVMQDYCGEYRSENTLQMGLDWLDGIRRERSRPGLRAQPSRTHADARVQRAPHRRGDHDARVTGPQGQQRGPLLQTPGLSRDGPAGVEQAGHHPAGRMARSRQATSPGTTGGGRHTPRRHADNYAAHCGRDLAPRRGVGAGRGPEAEG